MNKPTNPLHEALLEAGATVGGTVEKIDAVWTWTCECGDTGTAGNEANAAFVLYLHRTQAKHWEPEQDQGVDAEATSQEPEVHSE